MTYSSNNSLNSFSSKIQTMSIASKKTLSSFTLGRRGLERLDLLLLVIEALEPTSGESLFWEIGNLGLFNEFPNRVELWKCRCYNPQRKTARRGELKSENIEGLILLLCSMSDKLYPIIHQLLCTREPQSISQSRWNNLEKRLHELIEERMNMRRGAVYNLLNNPSFKDILRDLVFSLALASGSGGYQRLRDSLIQIN